MATSFSTQVSGQPIPSAHHNTVWQAVNKLEKGSSFYSADTGAANAYVVTLDPVPTAPTMVVGKLVCFLAANANTGASTLNVNGLGAVAIKQVDGSALPAGVIGSGQYVVCYYNGTVFILIAPLGRTPLTNVNSTVVGNVGAGEDNLQSLALPANSLVVNGQYLEAEWTLTFAANANGKEVKAYWGGTTVFASGAQNQNGGSMVVNLRIIRTGAATQIWRVTVTNSASSLFANVCAYGTATETLSGAVTAKTTGEATTTDDIQSRTLIASWG